MTIKTNASVGRKWKYSVVSITVLSQTERDLVSNMHTDGHITWPWVDSSATISQKSLIDLALGCANRLTVNDVLVYRHLKMFIFNSNPQMVSGAHILWYHTLISSTSLICEDRITAVASNRAHVIPVSRHTNIAFIAPFSTPRVLHDPIVFACIYSMEVLNK
jgi:hypothetical protein